MSKDNLGITSPVPVESEDTTLAGTPVADTSLDTSVETPEQPKKRESTKKGLGLSFSRRSGAVASEESPAKILEQEFPAKSGPVATVGEEPAEKDQDSSEDVLGKAGQSRAAGALSPEDLDIKASLPQSPGVSEKEGGSSKETSSNVASEADVGKIITITTKPQDGSVPISYQRRTEYKIDGQESNKYYQLNDSTGVSINKTVKASEKKLIEMYGSENLEYITDTQRAIELDKKQCIAGSTNLIIERLVADSLRAINKKYESIKDGISDNDLKFLKGQTSRILSTLGPNSLERVMKSEGVANESLKLDPQEDVSNAHSESIENFLVKLATELQSEIESGLTGSLEKLEVFLTDNFSKSRKEGILSYEKEYVKKVIKYGHDLDIIKSYAQTLYSTITDRDFLDSISYNLNQKGQGQEALGSIPFYSPSKKREIRGQISEQDVLIHKIKKVQALRDGGEQIVIGPENDSPEALDLEVLNEEQEVKPSAPEVSEEVRSPEEVPSEKVEEVKSSSLEKDRNSTDKAGPAAKAATQDPATSNTQPERRRFSTCLPCISSPKKEPISGKDDSNKKSSPLPFEHGGEEKASNAGSKPVDTFSKTGSAGPEARGSHDKPASTTSRREESQEAGSSDRWNDPVALVQRLAEITASKGAGDASRL